MNTFAPKYKLASNERFAKYINGENINPVGIEVSLTGVCNASCEFCFYKNNQDDKNIDTAKLVEFIINAEMFGLRSVTWTGGGEPTLHSDFKYISDYIYNRSVNLKQGLITNALNPIDYNPKIFEWIRVSKTNRDANLKNIESLRRCKKLGICINDEGKKADNEKVINACKDIVDYIQIRPALKRGNVLTSITKGVHNNKKVIPTDYKYSESNQIRKYGYCEGFHFVPFLWHDGILSVCAYQRNDSAYEIGSIYDRPYEQLLSSFPNMVVVNSNCQTCCKNHEINDMISSCKKLENVEFI